MPAFLQPPLLLGEIALLAGLLAVFSAVFATRQERRSREGLPTYQLKIEVDGTAMVVLTVHSRARSAAELASSIRSVLSTQLP